MSVLPFLLHEVFGERSDAIASQRPSLSRKRCTEAARLIDERSSVWLQAAAVAYGTIDVRTDARSNDFVVVPVNLSNRCEAQRHHAAIHTLVTGSWIRKGAPLCLIDDSGAGERTPRSRQGENPRLDHRPVRPRRPALRRGTRLYGAGPAPVRRNN